MKIETMTFELQQKLWGLWQAETPRMSMEYHGLDPFLYLLCGTDDADWYLVDETAFIVCGIEPGWKADLISMGLDKVNEKKARIELQAILDEYNLQRLTLAFPWPVRRLNRAAHKLGFKTEGKQRDATFFEGVFTDLALHGLHRASFQAHSRGHRAGGETKEVPRVAGESEQKAKVASA